MENKIKSRKQEVKRTKNILSRSNTRQGMLRKKKRLLLWLVCLVLPFVGALFLFLKIFSSDVLRDHGAGVRMPEGMELRDADLVCRVGFAWYSDLFRSQACPSGRYSHIGIVAIKDHKPFVYHSEDFESAGHHGVCIEPLDSFLYSSSVAGIYRLERLTDQDRQTIVAYAQNAFCKRLPFDYLFDAATEDKVYCTEFIANCLLAAPSVTYVPKTTSFGLLPAYSVDDLIDLPGTVAVWHSHPNDTSRLEVN